MQLIQQRSSLTTSRSISTWHTPFQNWVSSTLKGKQTVTSAGYSLDYTVMLNHFDISLFSTCSLNMIWGLLFPCTFQIYIFFLYSTVWSNVCPKQTIPGLLTNMKISTRGALSAYILCLDRHTVAHSYTSTNQLQWQYSKL